MLVTLNRVSERERIEQNYKLQFLRLCNSLDIRKPDTITLPALSSVNG